MKNLFHKKFLYAAASISHTIEALEKWPFTYYNILNCYLVLHSVKIILVRKKYMEAHIQC